MHAPPAFQLTVRHFGAWRWGSAVVTALALLTTGGWSTSALGAYPGWLFASALVVAFGGGSVSVHAWRLAAFSLRWDGQVWHFGPASTTGQEPRSGRLSVAMDLGVWMLLHLQLDGARRGIWLPVQRAGHELDWHRLRATVYCARPVFQPTTSPF